MPIVYRSRVTLAAMLWMIVLLTGCATTPRKSPTEARSEVVTADRVYSALNADPIYYFRHVDVRVDGGVAYLGGYVWSTDAIYRAKQIAASVPGVSRVVDQMELQRQGGRGGPSGSS